MPATHLRAFGYTTRPADSAWGLEYAEDYRKYAARHPAEADARWRNPSAGQPPLVQFWYRESPQPLSAGAPVPTEVDYDDPPFAQSGMLRLDTDPDGKLTPSNLSRHRSRSRAPRAAVRLEQALPSRRSRSHPISNHRSHLDSARQLGLSCRLDGHRPRHRSEAAHRSCRLARSPRVFPHYRAVDNPQPHDARRLARTRFP